MMYKNINSLNDAFNDRYVYMAELVGKYDMPRIPLTPSNPIGCKPVDFCHSKAEKNPKKSMCHFFMDDYYIEKMWTNADKYIPILQNYKYVIAPDYSVYDNMTRTMQIYNTYRNRALNWYMLCNDINVIPCVEMGGKDTWDFVFDGLPKYGTIALTTNGAMYSEDTISESFESFDKMLEVLEPTRVVIVGRDIGFRAEGVDIQYFESCGQQLARKGGKQ